MADGNIIAPIITAHISQTAIVSKNDQSARIGIISDTIGDDAFAVGQMMRAQPIAESATSACAPLRIWVPFELRLVTTLSPGSVPVSEISREAAPFGVAEVKWCIPNCKA